MADNIVKERTPQNVEYCNEKIEDVYHQLFDEALERFNAKQKRNDRKIDDYYEKIRSGKQERNSLKNGKPSRKSRKKALLLIAKARARDAQALTNLKKCDIIL